LKKNFSVFSALILGCAMLTLAARSQTPPSAPAQTAAPPAAPAPAPTGPFPTKIGIINATEALITTKEGGKAMDDLQKNVFQPKKDALDKLNATIQSNTTKLHNAGLTMSPEAQRSLQAQIDADTKSLNRQQEDDEADLQEQQGKIMQELGAKLMTILQKYATDFGYAVVLDVSNQQTPVLWAAGEVNITADIVKLYDEKYPLGAAAAAPAAPARPAATPPAAGKAPATTPAGKKQ
jgi:outer membrane protein